MNREKSYLKSKLIEKVNKKFVFSTYYFEKITIYDSFETRNVIYKLTLYYKNGESVYNNYYNIDSIKQIIKNYEINNNIKLYGINETINSLKKYCDGYYYYNKDKNNLLEEVEKNRKKGIYINIID